MPPGVAVTVNRRERVLFNASLLVVKIVWERSRLHRILDLDSCTVAGVAQPGRALRSGRRGRWFKSSHPD